MLSNMAAMQTLYTIYILSYNLNYTGRHSMRIKHLKIPTDLCKIGRYSKARQQEARHHQVLTKD